MGFATPLTLPGNLAKESAALQIETLAAAAQASADAAEAAASSVQTIVGDERRWPCVSGEDFPPTFGSGVSYGSSLGLPAVQVASHTVTATWPNLVPHRSTRHPDRTTLVVSFLVMHGSRRWGLDVGYAGGFGTLLAGVGVLIGWNTAQTYCQSHNGATREETDAAEVTDDGLWHRVDLEIAAASVKFTIDDVLLATHEASVPPVDASNWVPHIRFGSTAGTSGQNAYLSDLRARWEAPA